MKKALIAIISVIYVAAIILVSFLGTRSTIINKTIYVTALELHNTSIYHPDTHQLVVLVKPRPDEDEIGKDGKDASNVVWNEIEDGKIVNRISHYIMFSDLKYVESYMENEYSFDVRVKPDNATKKDLQFYCSLDTFVSVTDKGLLTFIGKPTGTIVGDLVISSTDMSGVELHLKVVLNKY